MSLPPQQTPHTFWRVTCALMLAGMAAHMTVVPTASGQTTTPEKKPTQQQPVASANALTPLTVNPQAVTVDRKTHTATVRITNDYKDTLQANLQLRYRGFHPRAALAQGLIMGDAALEDSLMRDSLRLDSLEKRWSLAPWARDWPQDTTKRIVLAPHETKTITIQMMLPDTIPSGEYTVNLFVQPLVPMTLSMNMGFGGGAKSQTSGVSWSASSRLPVVVPIIYRTDHASATPKPDAARGIATPVR